MNLGQLDVGRSISAAGTTQATATLLINGVSPVTTVASGAGVILYQAIIGATQVVFNGGANPVNVYPPVGYKINNLTVNGPHVLGTNTACIYVTIADSTATTPQIIGILSA